MLLAWRWCARACAISGTREVGVHVILVGSGGREAALAWKMVQSPILGSLVVTGDNPGWPEGVIRCPVEGVEDEIGRAHV